MEGTKEIDVKRHLEFSTFYRWHHWVRFFAVTLLIASGFYLAYPFLSPEPTGEPTGFLFAINRSLHMVFGFVLISMFIGKTYYFFFVRSDRNEIRSIKDVFSIKKWMKQIGYYLFMSKHPATSGTYNVVQFMAYMALYLILALLIITGLVLYVHSYHEGLAGMLYEPMRYIEMLFGGLVVVREVHHILTWVLMFFIITHIYMAIFSAIYGKEGTIESIFSGYKWSNPHSEE